MEQLLALVKLALRVSTNVFDTELTMLINACILDLGIAGVSTSEIGSGYLQNQLFQQAVITYCKLHFGKVDSRDYALLKASYDEQKAQMSNATGYTVWIDPTS